MHGWGLLGTLGVQVQAVMTDNAFCYTHRTYATVLATFVLSHLRIRPYNPRTNGRPSASSRARCGSGRTSNPIGPRGPALAGSAPSSHVTRRRDLTRHGRKPPISRLSA
jgi:hypothetical protein